MRRRGRSRAYQGQEGGMAGMGCERGVFLGQHTRGEGMVVVLKG